ncbi:MAG: DUF481 domain-containing protein [Pirellulales bacterium]
MISSAIRFIPTLHFVGLLIGLSCSNLLAQQNYQLPYGQNQAFSFQSPNVQLSVFSDPQSFAQPPVTQELPYLAPAVNSYPPIQGDELISYDPLPVLEPIEPLDSVTEIVNELSEPFEIEELDPSDYGYFEAIPYDEWFHADYWFGRAKWKNSLELGLNGQTGNAESINFRVGGKIKREGKHANLLADIKHSRASSSGVQNENNALFNAKAEWPIMDRKWHFFLKNGLEYDEFKDFDLRVSVSGGLGYKWIKNDRTDLTLSFGSGISREYGSPDESIVPEGLFGLELDHELTERQSIDLKIEHFPDWTGFGEFRNVTDFGYNIMLDERLSLKLGLVNRYDSTPNNSQRNDLNYAFLLLWKI